MRATKPSGVFVRGEGKSSTEELEGTGSTQTGPVGELLKLAFAPTSLLGQTSREAVWASGGAAACSGASVGTSTIWAPISSHTSLADLAAESSHVRTDQGRLE